MKQPTSPQGYRVESLGRLGGAVAAFRQGAERSTMAEDTGSPIFTEAVRRFRDFLRSQQWPDRILWFRADDFGRVPGRPIIILRGPSGDGSAHAVTSYERGRRANLGVSLEAVCTHDGSTCAIVAYPADEREAERLMYPSDGSLKLSAAVPRTEAV